ncbi:MAG: hypothetical protein H6656_19340 [Ardenticatenaceae bacterium]|nr:hypothetical protein [Ardenticatenaceae bacterium]
MSILQVYRYESVTGKKEEEIPERPYPVGWSGWPVRETLVEGGQQYYRGG